MWNCPSRLPVTDCDRRVIYLLFNISGWYAELKNRKLRIWHVCINGVFNLFPDGWGGHLDWDIKTPSRMSSGSDNRECQVDTNWLNLKAGCGQATARRWEGRHQPSSGNVILAFVPSPSPGSSIQLLLQSGFFCVCVCADDAGVINMPALVTAAALVWIRPACLSDSCFAMSWKSIFCSEACETWRRAGRWWSLTGTGGLRREGGSPLSTSALSEFILP